MNQETMTRRSMITRIGGASLAVVFAAVGFSQVAEASGPVSWFYAGLDWVFNNSWLRSWETYAAQRIRNIRTNWKRIALEKALAKAVGGAVASEVKAYLQGQGMYCPDKPHWLLLGPYDVAWVIITCTHHAE